MARTLRADEETLAELLQRTGMTRPAARCLVCLARGGDWTTTALAETAALSQPGVSQGTRELLQQRLIQRQYQYSGQKGRPAHIYALTATAGETLAQIEQDRRATLNEELAALDELKRAIKTITKPIRAAR